MKRIVPLLLFGLSVLSCSGCHGLAERPPAVEVVIDGDGQFPDFLVGTWKADSGGWEIVFEPEGTISSAVVSLGRVRMKPGKVTTVPMKLGGKGVFEAGPWAVQYSPERRELVVEIAIASFRVELGGSVVKGRTLNIFAGSVSTDGRSWWANRFSFPEYVADTKKYRDHRLTADPNDNPPEELLFQKVTESQ
ncbi:MAG: hypothetical protein AMJ65_08920 [Phycisphaerae bacterium SG8_4]|nr:MAG: hypothetical protein AMJ65_08920 [Phycisphaerae bacterium SG8_4]